MAIDFNTPAQLEIGLMALRNQARESSGNPKDRELNKTQSLILESAALPQFPKLKIRF
jgi:hypothetical protein